MRGASPSPVRRLPPSLSAPPLGSGWPLVSTAVAEKPGCNRSELGFQEIRRDDDTGHPGSRGKKE
eukprot:6682920-Prorocentrum_lima.AAC.1